MVGPNAPGLCPRNPLLVRIQETVQENGIVFGTLLDEDEVDRLGRELQTVGPRPTPAGPLPRGGRRKYDPGLFRVVRLEEGGNTCRAARRLQRFSRSIWQEVQKSLRDNRAGLHTWLFPISSGRLPRWLRTLRALPYAVFGKYGSIKPQALDYWVKKEPHEAAVRVWTEDGRLRIRFLEPVEATGDLAAYLGLPDAPKVFGPVIIRAERPDRGSFSNAGSTTVSCDGASSVDTMRALRPTHRPSPKSPA